MIIVVLILLGLCLGSFVNALVWRLHQQSQPKKERKAGDKQLSITKGRSMCVHCGHKLSLVDLIPIVSWLGTRGKCRYCHKPVSWQYPLVEAAMAGLYVLSYLNWPETFDSGGYALFAVWLACLTGMVALVIYDIRWMLLPNKLIVPITVLAAVSVLVDTIFVSKSGGTFIEGLLGALVGGGIFYIIFQVSKGKWIGGGDVKLGFFLGLIVGGPIFALLVLFLASLMGTLLIAPLMAMKKIGPKARIPFGPFLIAAAIITRLFGQNLIDAYLRVTGL